jgi:hypothetical protein
MLAGINRFDDAHANCVTGFGVDQDEAAGLPAVGVRIDRKGPIERDDGGTNVIRGQVLRSPISTCFEIDDLEPRIYSCVDRPGRELEQIRAAWNEALGASCDEPHAEPPANLGWRVGGRPECLRAKRRFGPTA